MKTKIYIAALAAAALTTFSGCEDFLNPESKTDITYNYLISTPDGLSRAVIGLYNMERNLVVSYEGTLYAVNMCDFNTDLMVFRAGTAAGIARLNTLLPNTAEVQQFWTHYYSIIGKANEIIASAEILDLENAQVKQAWGEARLLRAHAYFELWKRFERLYLNTLPTTVDNLERTFTPASKADVFTLIKDDLKAADDALAWEVPGKDYGRVTKAVAKHIRAQVAMWEADYDTAIDRCEEIFTEGTMYGLMPKTADVFNGADLRNSEVLWSYQFSENLGGGGTGTPLLGHRVALVVTTRMQSNVGCIFEAAQGGYGWGRVYPNSYLLGLYDQQRDTRYNNLFIHDFYYNDPAGANYGKVIPRNLYGSSSGYIEKLHPMSKKHFDQWTNASQPDRTSSFKDLIIYRLAETYLMCCEAYFHRDGGSSAEAIEYYNKTWQRAGNLREEGPLTLDMILDEYARELHFEGVRWPLLKRLGILYDRVREHEGNLKSEDPYLDTDYALARTNFVKGKHETWPIPQKQIDLMGASFPQSDPWK